MEVGEVKSSSGYGKPPWIFKGSALYQLHLVKAEKARACIPKEFKLVEAFGYTLGGFFLASYEDSPVGVFDELVVIAGLVWNRPTSCAWATRVYVNSDEACNHGRKEVGLPSQVARFSKRITAIPRQGRSRKSGFLDMIGIETTFQNAKDVQVTEIKFPGAKDMSNVSLTSAVLAFIKKPKNWITSMSMAEPALNFDRWMGPAIEMSLPSFSGGTKYNPNLLKYSCRIECRVRAVEPLIVSGAFPTSKNDEELFLQEHGGNSPTTGDAKDERQNVSNCVMLSRPILALKFSQMKMQVEAPLVLYHGSSSLKTCVSPVTGVP